MIYSVKMFFLYCLCAVFFFTLPIFSNAQTTDSTSLDLLSVIQSALTVQINPTYPEANEKTTITVGSYSTNLDGADISWSINGIFKEEAVGDTRFLFTTGNAGTITTVSATIITAENITLKKTFTFRPIDVKLLWQSDSYTPPFYKGKALRGYGSGIKVVAFTDIVDTNGKSISPDNLIYNWSTNGNLNPNQSGYGKKSITIANDDTFRSQKVSVTIQTKDGSMGSENSIIINPINPEVVLYRNDPLYGLEMQENLSKVTLQGSSTIELSAIPYYFNVSSQNSSDLEYDWSINNKIIGLDNNTLTFQNKDQNTTGNAYIEVVIENMVNYLQKASRNLNITFSS